MASLGLGTVTTAGIAELIAKTYDPVFSSLRDSSVNIKKLLFPETKEGNDRIRWHLNSNDRNKVRNVAEADLNAVITTYDAVNNPTGPLNTTTGSGAIVGNAFLTPNIHSVVDADLDIRHMVQTIMIGAKQLAAIKGGKDSFENILTREVEFSLQDWNREIEDQILVFNDTFRTGAEAAGAALDNLGTMLSIGGVTYANVNYTTYPEFKPYVNHNAGVVRALSISILQDVMNKLESGADTFRRDARVDMIVSGPAQFTNYGNLLTAQRRFMATETLDGGFQALEFNGRKFVSVPGFSANKLLFVDKQTPQGENSFEYRVLKNYSCEDRSDNTVGALLYVCLHMANTMCKGRRYTGVVTDLS